MFELAQLLMVMCLTIELCTKYLMNLTVFRSIPLRYNRSGFRVR